MNTEATTQNFHDAQEAFAVKVKGFCMHTSKKLTKEDRL